MKTLIIADKIGTRIFYVISDIPKPMIVIYAKPVLKREIVSLRD